jgi:DNA-binding NarL/FixJ family response regulator
VLVADDHALLRAAFRALLDGEEGMTVVGEAADGEEAVALARETRPDVVLMDISMPLLDGLEATRQIVADEALTGVRVLLLTLYETTENIYDGLRCGAHGFVLKNSDTDELIRAVRIVARGDASLAPSVTRRLLAHLASRPELANSIPEGLHWLTRREREVMALVVTGRLNKQIAADLGVSEITVKVHRSQVMQKMGAKSLPELARMADKLNLAPGKPQGA